MPNLDPIPTLAIAHPDGGDSPILINESDFDSAKHTLWTTELKTEPKTEPKRRRAKAATETNESQDESTESQSETSEADGSE